MLRPVSQHDAKAIATIYNYYVRHSIATLDELPMSEHESAQVINEQPANLPWIVYQQSNQVLGYAYARQWNLRSGYKLTLETTVYVKHNHLGMGIGKALYKDLILKLKQSGVKVIIAGISLPNKHSVTFHELFGFKKVAHFKQVGYKFEQWIDVGYWELIF